MTGVDQADDTAKQKAEVDEAKKHDKKNVTAAEENAKIEEVETESATTYVEAIPVPSLSVSLFAYWVLPVLMMVIFGRLFVDVSVPEANVQDPKPLSYYMGGDGSQPVAETKAFARPTPNFMKLHQGEDHQPQSKPHSEPGQQPSAPSAPTEPSRSPSPYPAAYDTWPTSYAETVKTLSKRKRQDPYPKKKSESRQSVKKSASDKRSAPSSMSDPRRQQVLDTIDKYRRQYQDNTKDVFRAIRLADALRMYDVTYHDGGTKQPEALKLYDKAIQLSLSEKRKLIDVGEPTDRSLSATRDIRQEVMMEYSQKSVDGRLCGLYTAKGKLLFMANMFEKAVESYTSCLDIEPLYLDALSSRGSSLIILGQYKEAGADLLRTIENDDDSMFTDAYTGISKVLVAKEEVVPNGWDAVLDKLEDLVAKLELMVNSMQPEGLGMVVSTLNRLHHVLFTYHDAKSKDTESAWEHLTKAYRYKMATLPPWQTGFEQQKVAQTTMIFRQGFWPPKMGYESKVPIFIVGFVRSGSTLLERVLDAHPAIVGTGEDSVFNGRLDEIRNKMVETSSLGNPELLLEVVKDLAGDVVDDMRARWEVIYANTKPAEGESMVKPNPERFVDKMLNNYYNVGFIHLLFPNALILHVVRDPMDTLFSAYKHEFPPGTLDYTSDFKSLAELYLSYRDLMDHWDAELPGRVTHVRYEDMVNDMPGVARKIIEATGLRWTDEVLDFHNKKHAVNTLSTTQVRKGVYRHSLQSWKRYEKELQPLLTLVGDRATTTTKTSLKGYVPPSE